MKNRPKQTITNLIWVTLGVGVAALWFRRRALRRLSSSLRPDQSAGRWDRISGAGKQALSHLTDDPSQAAEGLVQEAVGVAKQGAGRVVSAAQKIAQK